MRALILGLCFTLAVAKFEMSVEANAIADALAEMQLKGNSRASGMAVAHRDSAVALVKNLAGIKATRPSVEHQTSITTIIGMLQDILNDLAGDMSNDQGSLDEYPAKIAACDVQSHKDTEDAFESQQALLKTQHKSCRDLEATDYDAYTTDCGAFTTALNHAADDHTSCVADPSRTWTTSQTDMNDWLTFLNIINEWFNALTAQFNTEEDGLLDTCNDSLTAWTEKREECSAAQSSFQAEHCKWIHYKHSRCNMVTQCVAGHTADYELFKATAQTDSGSRTGEVEMLTLVVCYLKYIRDTDDGDADTMKSSCELSDEQKAEISANYSNTYNHDLTGPSCNATDGVLDPNDGPAWAAATYSDISSQKSPYDPVLAFCATDNWTTTP